MGRAGTERAASSRSSCPLDQRGQHQLCCTPRDRLCKAGEQPGSGYPETGSTEPAPAQVTVASASTELEENKPQPWQRMEELVTEASLSLSCAAHHGLSPWHTAANPAAAMGSPQDSAHGEGVTTARPLRQPSLSPWDEATALRAVLAGAALSSDLEEVCVAQRSPRTHPLLGKKVLGGELQQS